MMESSFANEENKVPEGELGNFSKLTYERGVEGVEMLGITLKLLATEYQGRCCAMLNCRAGRVIETVG
jgi:hypothetical protein